MGTTSDSRTANNRPGEKVLIAVTVDASAEGRDEPRPDDDRVEVRGMVRGEDDRPVARDPVDGTGRLDPAHDAAEDAAAGGERDKERGDGAVDRLGRLAHVPAPLGSRWRVSSSAARPASASRM